MTNKAKFFIITILFALWWGGFTFYSSIVVHLGMEILGNHIKMGMITKSVTNYINAIGSIVLIISLVFLIADKNPGKNYLRVIGWEWFALVLLQLALFYVHHVLASMINITPSEISLQEGFYNIHRIYLLTSTAMWLLTPLLYYRLIKPLVHF
jgi:hypothetical protein